MTIKALFLDFYGTIVHEDDDIIPIICQKIMESTLQECYAHEISRYWWAEFSANFRNSYGVTFEKQRILELRSLHETIQHFQSNCKAEDLVEEQFRHWQKPGIFEDAKSFIQSCHIPVYILSNIDTDDIMSAIQYHKLQVTDIVTSEDVRSYKPRSDMFIEALERTNLMYSEVLHVGDSLTSDIIGAQSVGIRAVWMNRFNKHKPDHIQPDFICKNFNELREIIYRVE